MTSFLKEEKKTKRESSCLNNAHVTQLYWLVFYVVNINKNFNASTLQSPHFRLRSNHNRIHFHAIPWIYKQLTSDFRSPQFKSHSPALLLFDQAQTSSSSTISPMKNVAIRNQNLENKITLDNLWKSDQRCFLCRFTTNREVYLCERYLEILHI